MQTQRRNRRLWLLAALVITSLLLAACPAAAPAPAPAVEPTAQQPAEPGTPTVAFSGFSSTNEFWLTLARAAEARAKELGVNFVNVTTPDPDAQAQVAAVENAISQKVDAIIVGAADSRAFDDAFDKAQSAGIPVITVDTGIDHPWVKTLIQTDNLAAAKMAGQYIVDNAGADCRKLLIIGGAAGHQTGDARKNGVEEVAKAAGYQVIVEYADWLETKAAEIAQNQLTANPDICAVFAAWDPGAVAALSVINQKGLTDQIMLVGFDALPVALKAIQAGEMEATVRQDPARMGAEGLDLALKIINGETVPAFIPIDGVMVDATNVDQFLQPEAGAQVKPAEEYTIAFSGFSSTNEFWLTLARAAEAQANELGVNFVNVTTPDPDAQAQVAAVENAISQKVDAIIVGAADSRAFDDAFDKAQAAGIPIITVDTGIDHPWVKTLIQTDNEAAATMAGEYLVEKAGPDCKKLLIIGGAAGHQTGDARKNGVESAAKAAGYEVIVEYADWLETKAAEIAQNQLTANPDICAVFAAWDPGAVAALSVINQKGLTDKITLVGFDALPVALKAIKAGEMTATVRQDPARMGAEGIDLTVRILNGEDVPMFTPIDGLMIDASNVDQYLTE